MLAHRRPHIAALINNDTSQCSWVLIPGSINRRTCCFSIAGRIRLRIRSHIYIYFFLITYCERSMYCLSIAYTLSIVLISRRCIARMVSGRSVDSVNKISMDTVHIVWAITMSRVFSRVCEIWVPLRISTI